MISHSNNHTLPKTVVWIFELGLNEIKAMLPIYFFMTDRSKNLEYKIPFFFLLTSVRTDLRVQFTIMCSDL